MTHDLERVRRRIETSTGLERQTIVAELATLVREYIPEMTTGQLLDIGMRCTEVTDHRFDDEVAYHERGGVDDAEDAEVMTS